MSKLPIEVIIKIATRLTTKEHFVKFALISKYWYNIFNSNKDNIATDIVKCYLPISPGFKITFKTYMKLMKRYKQLSKNMLCCHDSITTIRMKRHNIPELTESIESSEIYKISKCIMNNILQDIVKYNDIDVLKLLDSLYPVKSLNLFDPYYKLIDCVVNNKRHDMLKLLIKISPKYENYYIARSGNKQERYETIISYSRLTDYDIDEAMETINKIFDIPLKFWFNRDVRLSMTSFVHIPYTNRRINIGLGQSD